MKKGKDEGIFYKNDQKSTLHCLKEQITKPGICTPPHFHRYNEILYGIDCDIKVWIDDALENFKSGDICFVHSNETHFMYSKKEQNTYYVVKFSPEILNYDGQMISEMRHLVPMLRKNDRFNHVISQTELENYDMETLFKNIFEEWKAENTGYEFAIRGQILRMFSILLRVWEKSQSQPFTTLNDESAMAIYTAIAYIDENYDTVSERQISDALHMSYNHFSRTFKRVTGKNFSQFVIDTRIERAKKFLLTTSYSITDIAQKTGFSSSSHLISYFKQRTGMTPGDYKKNISIYKEIS